MQEKKRKSAVLTFLSVLSLLSLTWKAKEQNNAALGHSMWLFPSKQIHIETVRGPEGSLSACVACGSHQSFYFKRTCYIIVLYQKPAKKNWLSLSNAWLSKWTRFFWLGNKASVHAQWTGAQRGCVRQWIQTHTHTHTYPTTIAGCQVCFTSPPCDNSCR